jgi:hypothetical protein
VWNGGDTLIPGIAAGTAASSSHFILGSPSRKLEGFREGYIADEFGLIKPSRKFWNFLICSLVFRHQGRKMRGNKVTPVKSL